jgi:hypothetical protein
MPGLFRRHGIAVVALTVLTVWWLSPVLRHLGTSIPGVNAGDNVSFLWNVWWMGYVLHHPGYSFFFTPFLFHPFGVDLTLHTHTALPAFAAALFGPGSLVASQNVLVIAHVWLNFVCAYALAYRLTRHTPAALVAGLVFGASPFVAAHLTGHFNLIAAWVVPLVCLLAWHAAERASMRAGAVLGVALAAVAYVDYYLFIFAGLLVVLRWIAQSSTITLRAPRRSVVRRSLLTGIVVLLALDALIIVWILTTEVDRIAVGSLRVSVRGVGNPVTFGWLLLLAATALLVAPRVLVTVSVSPVRQNRRALLTAAVVAAALLLPLLVNGVKLWSDGRYVSQRYLWRSAPGGVDAATLVLGNPFNLWWADRVRGTYSRLDLDPIEGCGWIPAGALVLAAIAVAAQRRDPVVREWVLAGALFLIWSLGPWLLVFGRQTPLILPGIALRFVPIVANARIPGRAMVVVYLAAALLAAFGTAWLARHGGRRQALAWCLALLVAVESAPAATPVYRLTAPSLYARLKDASRPGAVCELPLGLRDGFGETGAFDSEVLFAQSIHERPIVGGFVARLPPDITRKYLATPVLESLLRLSAGDALSGDDMEMDPVSAAAHLTSLGIVYLVVDTRRAPPDLLRYVRSAIALKLVGEEDGRVFYEVSSGRAARDGAAHRSSGRPAQPAKELEEEVGVSVQPVLRQVGRRDEQAGARDHPALKNQMFRHGVPGLERIGDQVGDAAGVNGVERIGLAVVSDDDDAEGDVL